MLPLKNYQLTKIDILYVSDKLVIASYVYPVQYGQHFPCFS